MKSKKSTGCDRISSRFFLYDQRGWEIAYPLSVVIYNSLSSGIIPDSMKIAKVIPVNKAKNRQNMSNWPISLSVFFKSINTLKQTMYSSTAIHGVAKFIQYTIHSYDNKLNTISAMLDISKAFDTIDHEILIHKLLYYLFLFMSHKSLETSVICLLNKLKLKLWSEGNCSELGSQLFDQNVVNMLCIMDLNYTIYI